MSVKLAERPARSGSTEGEAETPGSRDGRPAPSASRAADPAPPLGVTVREMDRMFVGRLEIPESVQGVIVTRVDPTGARTAGAPARLRHPRDQPPARRPRRPSISGSSGAARTGDALAIYYFDPTVGQRALVTVVVD